MLTSLTLSQGDSSSFIPHISVLFPTLSEFSLSFSLSLIFLLAFLPSLRALTACGALTALNVRGARVGDGALAEVAKNCVRLTELSASYTRVSDKHEPTHE